jgi:NADPH:quinone reductase-like Zn-dependent oxidoreductase
MQAIRLKQPGGLENLIASEIDPPAPPGPGEIQVRLHASSLNYHDFAVAIGAIPTPDGRIPLSDGAGVVTAAGAGVSRFKPGDSVVSCFFPDWPDGPPRARDFAAVPGDGTDGYARQSVTVPAHYFTRAPGGWSHAEAATLTTAGLTAWRALVVEGGIKPGDTVLVMGTGGVSIFALQIARSAGASVIATSSSEQKLERLRSLGAAHVINYKTNPEWGREVVDATDGRGVDHVVEVGGPGTLAQSIRAVRVGGHISLIGVLTGRSGEVPTAALMFKQARLVGIGVGNHRHQEEMVRAMEITGIRPVIDRVFPLHEIAQAFRHEASGQHFGKICLEI